MTTLQSTSPRHRSPRIGRRLTALVLGAGALVAACSDGATSAPTTTETPTTSTSTTTSTTSTLAPTTTTIPVPVYPLTGLPRPGDFVDRPAIVVKIDNAPAANPQTGFNAADIVFEEIVNDHITRFAMIFHSGGSDPVGPIRSGRLQDIDLFGMLNKPLFSWSGGNVTVTQAIDDSDLVNMGPSRVPAYYRDDTRKQPHNLYSNTTKLWEKALDGWGLPTQLFQYRTESDTPAGIVANGVKIDFDSYDAEWTWNAMSGLYERKQNGDVHLDKGTNSVITTNNVVILVMDYIVGVSGSPDAQSVGTGEAWVFSGGKFVRGTWTRASRTDPFVLTDDTGAPILLTPGRTFVELPRKDSTMPF
ncbi:MAG: DUF3048 domain-containing protein [Ilumatobacteraceae bacterium]